jgi:Flp pilus assembly protein TadD
MAATLGLGVFLVGCAALDGARLYASGTEALDRGDLEVAVSDLERAARLVPDDSEVHNHLGLDYSAAGREADAVREFRRAVELDCSNQAAHANLRATEARISSQEP